MKGIMLIPGRLALPITRRLCILFHPLCALPLLWIVTIFHGLLYLDFPSGMPAGLFSSVPVSAHLVGYLLILLSVLFHEFGHLSACTYFNCPHGEIRLGLYLVFPVFYANVSPAWRLQRKARVVVDLAGMYFQLLMTTPVSLLFLLSREPLWLLFFLELDGMILLSLNPFLRFDGYWLCSDLLGVPNLRSRSQLLMKALCNRLIRGGSTQEAPLLRIRPGPRLGLALYAIASCLFGGLVLALMCRILPSRIQALPSEFRRLLEEVTTDWSQGDLSGVLFGLLHLVFLGLVVVAAARMLRQIIPVVARAARIMLQRLRQGFRKNQVQG